MADRLKNIRTLQTEEGKRYRPNVVYPSIPETEDDIYVIATGGDRYDTLAQQFYNNKNEWWIIATANTADRGSLNIIPGTQIRIPSNPAKARQLYEELNSKR